MDTSGTPIILSFWPPRLPNQLWQILWSAQWFLPFLGIFNHFSSIGAAKAALESLNGENLFGSQGASWSVAFVDIDAHNRNRTIFDTILPRESFSKVSVECTHQDVCTARIAPMYRWQKLVIPLRTQKLHLSKVHFAVAPFGYIMSRLVLITLYFRGILLDHNTR